MAKSSSNASLSPILRVRFFLEAIFLRLFFFAIRLLPLDTASEIGGVLGRTFGPLIPRTHVARRNIQRAFPAMTRDGIEATIRGMWDNLGRTIFEYPHLDRFCFFSGADLGRTEVVGAEYIDLARDDGKAGIFFSGHFANWELMGLCAAERGVPLNLIYRAPNNPFLGWLFEKRRSGNAEMLPKGAEGAKRGLALLRKGAHLGMLVDQKMNDGIVVPFLGRDAMTAPALAQFALRYDCPVIPARVERLDGAKFRITVLPPLLLARTGDRQADIFNTMVQVNGLLEQWIRDRPEQWLWLHRRWPE